MVPTESFFNFFKPPTPPEDDASDVDEDIDEKLELDYQIGEDIKDRVSANELSTLSHAMKVTDAEVA